MALDIVQKIMIEQRRLQLERQGITPANIRRRLATIIPEPRGVELRYNAALQRLQKEINTEVKQNVLSITAKETLEESRSVLDNFLTLTLPALVSGFASDTLSFSFKKYDKVIDNIVGFNALPSDVTSQMSTSWIKENVDLITNVNDKQIAAIRAATERATRSGARAVDLQKELNKIFKGSRNNVKLIARDQISKFSGQIDRAKQTSSGVKYYFWRTSRDERVRASHRGREGERFSWDSPPSDGHPGQAIGCRCTPEPDLSTLFGENFKSVA